jgi:hypothetical protein
MGDIAHVVVYGLDMRVMQPNFDFAGFRVLT